jgi:hypothetical protein
MGHDFFPGVIECDSAFGFDEDPFSDWQSSDVSAFVASPESPASPVAAFNASPASTAYDYTSPEPVTPGWKIAPEGAWMMSGLFAGAWMTNAQAGGLAQGSPPSAIAALSPRRNEHLRSRVAAGGTARATKNRNKIKKGEGKDARPDARDHYPFETGQAYQDITRFNGGPALAPIVFGIAKGLADQFSEQVTPLNRFARRRVPNAYSWMDDHWHLVDQTLLADLFHAVYRRDGLSKVSS